MDAYTMARMEMHFIHAFGLCQWLQDTRCVCAVRCSQRRIGSVLSFRLLG